VGLLLACARILLFLRCKFQGVGARCYLGGGNFISRRHADSLPHHVLLPRLSVRSPENHVSMEIAPIYMPLIIDYDPNVTTHSLYVALNAATKLVKVENN
jgi:hypothetical protein